MGAKGPLVWRLVSAGFLLVFCMLVNIGAAVAVNRCDTDLEQQVDLSCWGKMPVGLKVGFGIEVLVINYQTKHHVSCLLAVRPSDCQKIIMAAISGQMQCNG